MFTEAGRTQIADDQKDIGKNTKKVGAITATDGLKAPAIIAAITDNGNKNPDSQDKSTLDKIKDSVIQIGNNNQVAMNDETATLVATEELIVTGEITNDAAKQDIYSQLANELANDTDAQNASVYVNPDLTKSRNSESGTIVLGSANETSKQDIYLDKGALDRSDGVTVTNGQLESIINAPSTINVLNEEIAHSNGMGETSASKIGNLGEIAYNVGKWANSGDIAEAKGNIDTTTINNANTAQEQQEMLASNKKRLETQQADGDAFENRQLNNRHGRDEYWVVDRLYEKQGSKRKWTKAQIADALRSADFTKDGRTDDDEARTLLILTNANSVSDYKDWNDDYGAKWVKSGDKAYHLPVNRNVDPILGAWINQVIATDGDFKSYKYTWDVQNLKGNKPLPQILTPEKPKSKSKPKAVYQGKNPAKVVGSRELESINKSVENGADFRGGNLIQAESDKTYNEKIAPVAQAVFGAAEIIGGTTLCATGAGCVVGGAIIINGSDTLATGVNNYGEKQSDQVPSASLDAIDVPKEHQVWVKLGADITTGGVAGAQVLLKPKPKFVGNTTNKAGTVSKAEVKAAKIENNVNADNDILSNDLNRADFRWQTTKVNNPVVLDGLIKRNGVILKEGVSSEDVFYRVMTKEQGYRAKPDTYLDPNYIKQQLDLFDEGATKFMVSDGYEKYGIGQVDSTSFVLPKSQADDLIRNTNRDASKLADALGIPRDALQRNSLVRIDISNSKDAGLRLPSGNEAGANSSWIPGGKLPNGNTEAVIDADKISESSLKITTIE